LAPAGWTPAFQGQLLPENAGDLVVGDAARLSELVAFALHAAHRIVLVPERLRAQAIGVHAAACDNILPQFGIQITSKATVNYRAGKYCGKKKALY
jgi:hypothetical protein